MSRLGPGLLKQLCTEPIQVRLIWHNDSRALEKVLELKRNVSDIKRSTVDMVFTDWLLLWEDVDTYSVNR